MKATTDITVQKKVLSNGFVVLTRRTTMLPEVDVQLWYNVGSRDERDGERGMSHLIEHMVFKGSKLLSESDVNLITHKLSGTTNAFTSFDYTSYVFRFPNNAWKASFLMLADWMRNCIFNPEMLASELKAVISELKMYRDDYQTTLMEKLLSNMFMPHPYGHPIIGYKQDLWNLTRDNLYAFYQEHYHPGNGVLVVVGDIDPDEIFAQAENYFGDIPAKESYKKRELFFNDDVQSTCIDVYRNVEEMWLCYAYKIPGFKEQRSHVFYMAALLLAQGKSSRLYQALVDREGLASSVGAFCYDLFERDVFFISITPKNQEAISKIERIVDEEIERITKGVIEEWEFNRVHKKAQMDFLDMLEDAEEQAHLIGSSFLAFRDEHYLSKHFEKIQSVRVEDIVQAVREFMRPSLCHRGTLLPLEEHDASLFADMQKQSDQLDTDILTKHVRTIPVEQGRFVENVAEEPLVPFTYPKPQMITLNNGLEVYAYSVPKGGKMSMLLSLKMNEWYDDAIHEGRSFFHGRALLEGTKQKSAFDFSRELQSSGIYMTAGSGIISVELLSESFEEALQALYNVLCAPRFDAKGIRVIRAVIESKLKERADSAMYQVERLARLFMYPSHPYSNSVYGSFNSIEMITPQVLHEYHNRAASPRGASLFIAGDFGGDGSCEYLQVLLEKHLGAWRGGDIQDAYFPDLERHPATRLSQFMDRDQVALGVVAPSVSVHDKQYEPLSLLDVVITGGPAKSMSSRLFALRERSGLFYTIGGSLLFGSGRESGMLFIRTLTSLDTVDQARAGICEVFDRIASEGISQSDLEMAKRVLITSFMSNFSTLRGVAQTFFLLKKSGLPFDLFDKRTSVLSILGLDDVRCVAERFCKSKDFSVVQVGRVTSD